jgi:hypothetical protein
MFVRLFDLSFVLFPFLFFWLEYEFLILFRINVR